MSLNARDIFISTRDIKVYDAKTSAIQTLAKGTKCTVVCFEIDWNSGVLWTVHFKDDCNRDFKISSTDAEFSLFERGIKVMRGGLCIA